MLSCPGLSPALSSLVLVTDVCVTMLHAIQAIRGKASPRVFSVYSVARDESHAGILMVSHLRVNVFPHVRDCLSNYES